MPKIQSFGTQYSTAFAKLGLADRRRPDEVFPRVSKEDFEVLHKRYTDQYGYVVRIPNIEEIIHLVPNAFKTDAEIKAEKRAGLMNILASPTPQGVRDYYTTPMTWLDNIQDMTSVVYPAISMLTRWMPKIMSKAIPVLGWLMLGTDLLNMAIGVGRLPMNPMGGKRLWCEVTKRNPFNKEARFLRQERIRNFKPGVADLLQALQVTDQFMGVGLNLGPMMGTIMDAAFGAYRYLNGDRVTFAYDAPDLFAHEKLAGRGMAAASLINSFGQVFNEETHFWSLTMGAASARLFCPAAHDFDIVGTVNDPMNIMVPAARPTDPLTIEVIEAEGLNVERGVGWPYNRKKEMRLGDLWDELIPRNREVFRDYCFRHSHDFYGYTVASMWDQVLPSTIFAFDPTGSVEYDDTPEMKTLFRMLKAPLLPTGSLSDAQGQEFKDWIIAYGEANKRPPGIQAIYEKFESMGIKVKTSYPDERTPDAGELWPEDLPIADYNLA
jgi:hypothetical protein